MVGSGFLKTDLWSYILSTGDLMAIILPVSLAKEIIFLLIGQIRSVQESELVFYIKKVLIPGGSWLAWW